ncbi:MAG: rhodanese-like domain-containing protein [Methylococcaceae bacterium]
MKISTRNVTIAVHFVLLLLTGYAINANEKASLIAPEQAAQLTYTEEAIIVDVRSTGEWQSGHIPNAKHIPLDQLKSRFSELEQYKDRPIIMQCQGGVRSAKAAQMLKEAGFSKVFDLEGGLNAWEKEGLPKD